MLWPAVVLTVVGAWFEPDGQTPKPILIEEVRISAENAEHPAARAKTDFRRARHI